jgi:bifunctional UDP-N-acetylglucosamine pyrophosphorylase/glucosamine-1-phosphate N-acetyltransferase
VLVLAGGASNRFWPLLDKPLLRFGDQTLLERHLRSLEALGVERFVVVVRPETRQAVQALADGLGLRQSRVVVQAQARGMADAVLSAREALVGAEDAPIYVTQAQDVFDPILHTAMFQRWHQGAAADGLIAAVRVSEYFPGGYLKLEGNRITGVVEKPGASKEPSDLVTLVAHLFASTHRLVEAIEAQAPIPGLDDAYERALSGLMVSGSFRHLVYEGRWQALKFPWHVLDVMDLLLERWTAGQESPGPDYEQREDGVFVGRNVRIFPGAHVVAPALIGHDAIIGHNALVRGSLVGENSVVGFGSEVARSYLGRHVELHHNYVGDSVFGEGSSMGYGAVTANFRLDGRTVPSLVGGERVDTGRMKLGLILGAGARVGVNASTMPGVKMGAGAILGPNLRLARDLADGQRHLSERAGGNP